MKPGSPTTGYVRWDQLRALLRERLGDDATRPQMADHLGIKYLTFWRLTTGPGKDGKRFRATEPTVERILAAFPDKDFDDLFTEVEAKPSTAATKRDEIEKLYTVEQVAERWECSPDKVRRLIHRKQIPYLDIGEGKPKLRIPASAVNAYVAAELVVA